MKRRHDDSTHYESDGGFSPGLSSICALSLAAAGLAVVQLRSQVMVNELRSEAALIGKPIDSPCAGCEGATIEALDEQVARVNGEVYLAVTLSTGQHVFVRETPPLSVLQTRDGQVVTKIMGQHDVGTGCFRKHNLYSTGTGWRCSLENPRSTLYDTYPENPHVDEYVCGSRRSDELSLLEPGESMLR